MSARQRIAAYRYVKNQRKESETLCKYLLVYFSLDGLEKDNANLETYFRWQNTKSSQQRSEMGNIFPSQRHSASITVIHQQSKQTEAGMSQT